MYKATLGLLLLLQTASQPQLRNDKKSMSDWPVGRPLYEPAINNGAPFLQKSVNAEDVAPLKLTVDNSTPHTTTVHCKDGVFGVLINNETRTVQVTCYEHEPEPAKK